VIPNLKPRTRYGWALLILCVVTFAVLDVLALLGSAFATGLLIYLAGGLIGVALALALTYPIRNRLVSSGNWRLFGIVLALVSVLGVIFGGTGLANIPYFPTAAGGNAGNLIFGLALGVGVGFVQRLNHKNTRGPARPIAAAPERPEYGVFIVVVGAVAALFAASFVLYVLLEFVVGPLVRAFAS
jgi:hypothetical protein